MGKGAFVRNDVYTSAGVIVDDQAYVAGKNVAIVGAITLCDNVGVIGDDIKLGGEMTVKHRVFISHGTTISRQNVTISGDCRILRNEIVCGTML